MKKYTVKELGKLAAEVQTGNEECIAELYEALMPSMTKLAVKKLNANNKNEQNAKDIYQDTFIKCVVENIRQLQNTDMFVSWFSRAITNNAFTWNKKNNNPGICDSIENQEEEKFDKEQFKIYEEDNGDERTAEILEAVKHLKPEYREVVRMFYLEGNSYDEIVRKTGIRKSTLVGRLQCARKMLKNEMNYRDC